MFGPHQAQLCSPFPTNPQVPRVLVYHNEECGKRGDVRMEPGRDVFWQDAIPHQSPQARPGLLQLGGLAYALRAGCHPLRASAAQGRPAVQLYLHVGSRQGAGATPHAPPQPLPLSPSLARPLCAVPG